MQMTKPKIDDMRQTIITDLAERIEQNGREHFTVKAGNIRTRLIDVMRSGWPNSSDETLEKLAVKILKKSPPDRDAIFAEVRELNTFIAKSECPLRPYPGE